MEGCVLLTSVAWRRGKAQPEVMMPCASWDRSVVCALKPSRNLPPPAQASLEWMTFPRMDLHLSEVIRAPPSHPPSILELHCVHGVGEQTTAVRTRFDLAICSDPFLAKLSRVISKPFIEPPPRCPLVGEDVVHDGPSGITVSELKYHEARNDYTNISEALLLCNGCECNWKSNCQRVLLCTWHSQKVPYGGARITKEFLPERQMSCIIGQSIARQ